MHQTAVFQPRVSFATRPATRHARCICSRHTHAVRVTAAASAMTFNIAETSISFPFAKPQAQQLSDSITELIQTFAAKQEAERPKRWKSMEYKHQGIEGQPGQELEYLEVFCNPNAYATAFDAKVLITLRSGQGLKVTTEGRLSNLKGDVDTFLGQ